MIPRALEFLGRCRGRYPFDRLVSHVPLDRIDDAFRDAEWYNREATPAGSLAPHWRRSHPSLGSPSMTARLVPIGLITLVFNLGGGLIAPALPLYARTLGADYQDLGLIGAAHGLVRGPHDPARSRVGPIRPPCHSPPLRDRYRRRGRTLPPGRPRRRPRRRQASRSRRVGRLLADPGGLGRGTVRRARRRGHGRRLRRVRRGVRGGLLLGGFVIEAFGLRAPFVLYVGTAALAVLLVTGLVGAEASGRQEAAHGGAATPRIVTTDPVRARTRRALAYATGFVYVYELGTVLAFLPAYGADRALSPRGSGSCWPRTGSRESSARSGPAAFPTRWGVGWSSFPRCW